MFPWAQAAGSSLLGTLSLRAPAAFGGSQYVDLLHGHVGLGVFVWAGHSIPEECLVGGVILLGSICAPSPSVRGSEDCKLRVDGPCW